MISKDIQGGELPDAWGLIKIDVLIKSFECTVTFAGKVRVMLSRCYHYVAHHVIVDPLAVAYIKIVVGRPFDSRWGLVQDVARVF